MAYFVKYTDTNNNTSIEVLDNTTNTSTNLGFPGRNQKGYANVIAENFLHLLENFAASTPPNLTPGIGGQAVTGQLWYDSTDGIEELKVYDGSTWKSAGALKKASSEPAVSNSVIGDLWVDTSNQQLYLFNGSKWILVGPTFSSGLLTGARPEEVNDSTTAKLSHVILLSYVNDSVVTVASNTTFTPKSGISGFSTIKPGINLNSDSSYKYWGTSEKAENLVDGTNVFPASSFLRKNNANITTQPFTISNNSGLIIGDVSPLQLNITDNRGVLYHSRTSSKLDLRVNHDPAKPAGTTLVSLDSENGRVGIGIDNTSPTSSLSVKGTSDFDDTMRITSTRDTVDASSGALIVNGGVVFNKTLRVNDVITAFGQMNSSSIVPRVNATTDIDTNGFDIGTSGFKFRSMYANKFYGDLRGNVTGNVTGSVTGTASSLTSLTKFKMIGDVTSGGFSFDGSSSLVQAGSFEILQEYKIATLGDTNWNIVANTTGVTYVVGMVITAKANGSTFNIGQTTNIPGTAWTSQTCTFNTEVNSNFVNGKNSLTTTLYDTDELLINRPDIPGKGTTGLYKTTKSNLMNNLPFVPIGSIFPFAGPVSKVPNGYLLCDGSEKTKGVYGSLYEVIGDAYTSGTLVGKNTFKIPDLRGRFPLGLDNMDNGDTVPDKNKQIVNAGLFITGQKYQIEYLGDPGTESDFTLFSDADRNEIGIVFTAYGPGSGSGTASSTATSYVDSGGGPANRVTADTANNLGQGAGSEILRPAVNGIIGYTGSAGNISSTSIMNPYLAINYIIYAGITINDGVA